jgi:predicted P-loop ATPase
MTSIIPNQVDQEWSQSFDDVVSVETIRGHAGNGISQFVKAGGTTNPIGKAKIFKSPAVVKSQPQDTVVDGYLRHSNGRIITSKENLVNALSNPNDCGVDICFDNFKGEVVISQPDLEQWYPLKETDRTEICIRLEAGKDGFADISTERWRESVNLTAQYNNIDTAQTWIKSLKWDGVARIEKFLPNYLGTVDTAYTNAVSLYMWTAMAGRVMSLGCKVDMIPVLMGSQGAGKSEAIKALVPSETFYAEFDLKTKDDDQARMMRGVLVGEIAELNGLRGRDSEAVKAFITRTVESFIPKYMEYKTEFPRRLVFFGTTNDDEFLTDPTGNRRWLPFKVGKCRVAEIKVNREQLWAEALVTYQHSGIAWQKAEELAKNEHKAFIETDSWETPVLDWLSTKSQYNHQLNKDQPFSMNQVLTSAVNKTADKCGRVDEMRMAKVLKGLGFTKARITYNGKQGSYWIPIPTTNEECY